MNECLQKKIKQYIYKLKLDKYPIAYIPNHVIEQFKKGCDKND